MHKLVLLAPYLIFILLCHIGIQPCMVVLTFMMTMYKLFHLEDMAAMYSEVSD